MMQYVDIICKNGGLIIGSYCLKLQSRNPKPPKKLEVWFKSRDKFDSSYSTWFTPESERQSEVGIVPVPKNIIRGKLLSGTLTRVHISEKFPWYFNISTHSCSWSTNSGLFSTYHYFESFSYGHENDVLSYAISCGEICDTVREAKVGEVCLNELLNNDDREARRVFCEIFDDLWNHGWELFFPPPARRLRFFVEQGVNDDIHPPGKMVLEGIKHLKVGINKNIADIKLCCEMLEDLSNKASGKYAEAIRKNISYLISGMPGENISLAYVQNLCEVGITIGQYTVEQYPEMGV